MKQQVLLLLLATTATTRPMWIFTGASTPASAPTAPSSSNSTTINSGNSFSKDNKASGVGNLNFAVSTTGIPGADEGRDGCNPEMYDFAKTGIAGYKSTPDAPKPVIIDLLNQREQGFKGVAQMHPINVAQLTAIKKSPKNSPKNTPAPTPRYSPRTLQRLTEIENKKIDDGYNEAFEEEYFKTADDISRATKETISNIWSNVCDSYNKAFNNPKK